MHAIHRGVAHLPHRFKLRSLQRWYRRGYGDGLANRPALDISRLAEEQQTAYLTGYADGAAGRP